MKAGNRKYSFTETRLTELILRALPAEGYALLGRRLDGRLEPLVVDACQPVLHEVERLTATYPTLPLDARCLAPPPLPAWRYHERWVAGQWARVRCVGLTFAHADALYHALRAGDYAPAGSGFVAGDDQARVQLCPAPGHDPWGWAIAAWRLVHGAPPALGLPPGICPQCLSRYVIVTDGSARCQECQHGH